ncbi:TPA: pilus assembly protein PilV [Salmonella enterica subsp. enterica serovar Muenchen]
MPQCQYGRWSGTGKVSNTGCSWYKSPDADRWFDGGRGSFHIKAVICPANYVATGTRMFGVAAGVDDEHVDIYCCPFG